MKKTLLQFLVALLMATKKKITDLTSVFIRLVKDQLENDERKKEYEDMSVGWLSYSNLQKARWMLVLFIVVPILILVDYASLILFIDYLQYAVNSIVIGNVLRVIGIIIFFTLELGICFSIIRLNEHLEENPILILKFVKIILMCIMITLPSILIYTGYLLLPSVTQGDTMKTYALVLLSLAIHTALFILIDDVLRSITYIAFLIRGQWLKSKDTVKHIEKCKKELFRLYNQYDIDMVRLSEIPGAAQYQSTLKLDPRSQALREKLEEGLDEENYKELVNMKSHSSKPITTEVISALPSISTPSTGFTSYSTTVW
jgi:hypothetical protein